jgi:hypothetical protein
MPLLIIQFKSKRKIRFIGWSWPEILRTRGIALDEQKKLSNVAVDAVLIVFQLQQRIKKNIS